mgnify:CR=1 FL=1
MRYLAIDPGDRRTGLAIGDDDTGSAGPVDVLDARDADALVRGIKAAIDAYDAEALVIGLPLNMDGSTGPAAKKAEALARRLAAETGLAVHRVDERLTSYAADQQMAGSGLTRGGKKARRDALAAAVILQDFLNRQPKDRR